MKRAPLALRHVALGLLFGTMSTSSYAQEAPELVTNTFAWSQVINAQTVEIVPRKNSFGFMIQHRFGAITPDKQSYKQFLGLDLPSNIRFGFQYAVSGRVHFEIGRSKNGKVIDLAAKARILRQSADNKMPVSVTGFFDAGVMTDDFPSVGADNYFGDGTTPFVYAFKHRMSYNTQVIVARRFNDVLSLQFAGVSVYRNLVPQGASNLTIAAPISGRIKVSTKGAILLEYTPILEGRSTNSQLNPAQIAYELATLGHVFQVIIGTSGEIVEQRLYPSVPVPYDEGHVLLGFNIARTLFVKPKKPRS